MFLKHLLTLIISSLLLIFIFSGCSEIGQSLSDKYGNDSVQTEESITGAIIDATSDIITDNALSDTILNANSSEILKSTLNSLLSILNDSNNGQVPSPSEQIFFSVKYDRSRDGDTAEFYILNAYKLSEDKDDYTSGDILISENTNLKFEEVNLSEVSNFKDGELITIRSLLIDTPELSKNQAFSKEALDFAHEELSNAKTILIAYDKGDRQDHYSRELMYIWCDSEFLSVKLLENGLAKVAYVNAPNTTYLDIFRMAEQKAKDKNIGIWSQN